MKVREITFLALACILCHARAVFGQAAPQDPAVLVEKLQSLPTTDQATQILLQQATVDARTKQYLSDKLPGIIETGWKNAGPQWENAVRLAGELKIAAAAPALAKWISLDNVGETSAGLYQRLETNPAGKALSQIGDPSIPALLDVFGHGNARERKNAYLVLNLIGSPLARTTIKEQAQRESDPMLRDFAERLSQVRQEQK